MTRPVPTQLDIANADRRAEIAARFRQQFNDALALAEQVLGSGWEPSGRHYLIDRDEEDRCRCTSQQPTPSATVITCRNAAGEQRHFRVETMAECGTPEAGFGDMLLENHATKRFTVKEVEYPIHRFSLCWGWFEPSYTPQTAEQLAAAREKREEKKEAKWQAKVEEAATGSLFPEYVRERAEEERKKGRKR